MKVMAPNFLTIIFLFSLLSASSRAGLARWAQGPESGAPTPAQARAPASALVPLPQNPTWARGDLQGCFVSFYENAPGCLQGIFLSFFKGRLTLGPACCEAINVMSDRCWALFFSNKPKLHPFIKAQCHPFLGGFQLKDM